MPEDDPSTEQDSPFEPTSMGESAETGATTKPDTKDPNVGRRIGRFHIKSVIGEGGMGTVYLAMQDDPRRYVAMKVMKRGVASRSALRRFKFEAQLLARLRHPGIAQIYETGTHDDGTGGVPYFAMEYVPGARPLVTYAREKKLDTRKRLGLFADVCDAVAHGHQKGIIHRDLKPDNILVDSSGRPRIVDFGVARATDSDLAVTTLQTDLRQIIGTLQYMSPEQCGNDALDIDTSSDVYALGVVLYELLCDQVPYDISDSPLPAAVERIRTQDPPRPSTINRALRGDVETIVLKALEKERDRRYRTAAELGDDVQRYLNDDPIMAHPTGTLGNFDGVSRKHTATAVGIAGAFGVLLAAFLVAIVMWGMTTTARNRQQQTIKQLAMTTADLWAAQLAEAPPQWADDEASRRAEKANELADRAAAAREALEHARASALYIDALAALREAVSLYGLAVPRLVARGIEAARAGNCDEAKSILRRLKDSRADNERMDDLLAQASLCSLEMGPIPAGEFIMGSPEGKGSANERPQRALAIEHPFLLSATEVTQGQFLAVMGWNPSFFKGDLDRPVEGVSWFDAVEFCNRLSERKDLSPRYEIDREVRAGGISIFAANVKLVEGTGYRLPSEAEWEYACRAGTETDFSFGDTTDPQLLDQYMWYSTNSGGTTHPVRRKKPNRFGLFDMHGNVWEWCEDKLYSYAGAPTTQQPWIGGGSSHTRPWSPGAEPDEPSARRVLRGGGWLNYPVECRSAFRDWDRPDFSYQIIGFRVALDTVSPSTPLDPH